MAKKSLAQPTCTVRVDPALLEEQRERVSAQLAFALTLYEEWRMKRVEETGVADGR